MGKFVLGGWRKDGWDKRHQADFSFIAGLLIAPVMLFVCVCARRYRQTERWGVN